MYYETTALDNVFALLLIACALVFGACGDKGEMLSGPRMYQVDGILKEASTPWKMSPEADTYEYGMRGYDLLGVYDNDGNLLFDANGKRVDGAMLEQDMVLVEHYKSKPLSLSFDAGVGRFDNGDSEITEAAHYNEPLAERALPIPTHPDPSYAFDGWFIKGSDIRFSQGGTAVEKNLNALTFETVLSENGLALEAVYFQKKVSLTVDFDNSEIPSVTTVFPYGTAMPDLSEYLHDDGRWAIAGWSLSATAQIAIPDTLTEDVTVFAVWAVSLR